MGEKLAPSVDKPRPRLRLGFVVALLVVMAAGVVFLLVRPRTVEVVTAPADTLRADCTPLGAELALAKLDAPRRAVCLALAGKTDRAHAALTALSQSDQQAAIAQLFAIAHPIADSWDDVSAGPIMELVVEFDPANYMAMFHAGMASAALGHDARASDELQMFLAMYSQEDIWRARAKEALAEIAAHVPVKDRKVHFAE